MSARLILRRLAALLRRGDEGVTLTELIVVMVLGSIVGALAMGLFVNMSNSSAWTIDRTVNSASARNAIQAWTAYLRVADGTTAGSVTNRIEWLTNKDMLFYADLGNRSIDSAGTIGPPTMIWLRLDSAGALVEEQFPSTAAQGATPSECRTLVTGVTTTTPTAALFTALDVNGVPLAPQGTAPVVAAGCQNLPVTVPSQTAHPDTTVQANLQNVNSVTIDFVVRDTQRSHPLEFTSQAVLPALGGM
jgi:prepilin-type N-terminal cleavage/methylation domain-containing protein